ncbi:4a-hydroxytetrahydrobiopterin dehydratase [Candidatus Roizmanbacteria bacterium]|nr:4a-hydroxytetrahydrobiopterin dehydratase [Candidatus Roizmanbacteria bacterium]
MVSQGVSLVSQKCVPCEGHEKPLTREEFEPHLKQIVGWDVLEDKKIEKDYKFKDFKEAMAFVNRAGELAENEGHHPDILLYGWNKVKIMLSTHAISGLSLNDFILAAKIDKTV